MNRFILFILLTVGLVAGALAATLNFNYTDPVKRMDGTAMSASEIGSHTLYKNGVQVATFPVGTTVKTAAPAGNALYTLTVVDTGNRESPQSATYVYIAAAPDAPKNVSAKVAFANDVATATFEFAAVPGAVKYTLYQVDQDGVTKLATVGNVKTLTVGSSTKYYAFSASNGSGKESGLSNAVMFTRTSTAKVRVSYTVFN